MRLANTGTTARLVTGLAAALLLAGCGRGDQTEVTGAWIRLPAVPGRPGAGYFRLHAGRGGETLRSLSTPVAGRVELHDSMTTTDGMTRMTRMTPLRDVTVAAGKDAVFAPGGRHAMIFDVDPSATAGARTTITLKFADGDALTVGADVVAAGDPPPAG